MSHPLIRVQHGRLAVVVACIVGGALSATSVTGAVAAQPTTTATATARSGAAQAAPLPRAAPPLHAVATFLPDRSRELVVEGSTTPGDRVTVTSTDTDLTGVAATADPSGAFRIPVPAEHLSGEHAFQVSDAAGPSTTVDADFGDAVTITSPADGAGGVDVPFTATGTGEPGSDVSLTFDDHVVSGAVAADGHWSIPVGPDPVFAVTHPTADDTTVEYGGDLPAIGGTGLPGSTARVVLRDTASGRAVTKTATVGTDALWNLPLDDDDVVFPNRYEVAATACAPTCGTPTPRFTLAAADDAFTIESPAAGAVVTTDRFVTFTGRGIPGALVDLSVGGTPADGQARVLSDGTWSFTTAFDASTAGAVSVRAGGEYGSATSTVEVRVGDPAAQQFAITSPVAGSSGPAMPGNYVMVEGTGPAGERIVLGPDSSTTQRTVIGADGTWRFLTRLTGTGPQTVTVRRADGTDARRSWTTTARPTATDTFSVTAPVERLGVLAGYDPVVYAGTGRAGGTVRLEGRPETAVVGPDNTWTLEVPYDTSTVWGVTTSTLVGPDGERVTRTFSNDVVTQDLFRGPDTPVNFSTVDRDADGTVRAVGPAYDFPVVHDESGATIGRFDLIPGTFDAFFDFRVGAGTHRFLLDAQGHNDYRLEFTAR
ncbi:hypothetical protein GCM10009769_01240 [Curtobacterium luteum]|uniref:Bacterial Ig domain-containing protein n=1 Tax=Curtobacterium luteum TaxID=33881 RepID=A0A8H9KZC4_9MICO|nr:hypothetical protein [Curtobacterium luteum]GGK86934.1 hypothetical protein GCM10009769_01240 [Curtobacterium luteum]